MKKLLIITLLFTFTFTLFAQAAFIAQDFEASPTDQWSYTPEPEELQRVILWGRMNQPVGNTTAYSGEWYWATWDLDNLEHTLVFDTVELPIGEAYTVHFHYYSANLNPATEFVKYCLEYDDGTEWNNWITLDSNLTGWTQVSIDIPLVKRSVRLKVSAKYDGFSKYVHWDNFVINSEPAPLTAPVVTNITLNQRTDGSKLVDITYDLYDANNDFCDISLLISDDEGSTYSFTADNANLTGDAGEGIEPGTNKQIIWDAGNETQSFSADNYFVRIMAEDNTYFQVATPVISPESGAYDEAQIITITCTTEDAEIYYTLDGNNPDQASTLYTEPFTLSNIVTVKARAYRVDWVESEIVTINYNINTDFVLVPGGTFTMGRTTGSGDSDELPTHQVTLSPFYISKYEVTQSEYQAVMGTNPASGYGVGANYPIYNVTWYNAVEYCNARSIQEGLTPCYNTSNWSCNFSANGYRLPKEAEWEYAARGATNNPDYLYSGSNDINSVAWYSSNSSNNSHSVGTKAPNSLGIYDMSGNVWEWCHDWYGSYSSGAQTDPVGPASGSYRVNRGGSWGNSATNCRVAFRNNGYPSNSYGGLGFRVARSSN